MSKLYVFKTLVDCDNPRKMYEELESYGLNVTNTGKEVYVYGNVESDYFEQMMRILQRYGTIIQ